MYHDGVARIDQIQETHHLTTSLTSPLMNISSFSSLGIVWIHLKRVFRLVFCYQIQCLQLMRSQVNSGLVGHTQPFDSIDLKH